MRRPPAWWEHAALALVLAFALWLRVRGLGFGLPAVYNMDESAIMARALAFAKGDLNPHNFLYPTFYFYVLFSWIGGYFVAGRAAGVIPSLEAFQAGFFIDPTGIYLAGRALSVACGVATVWVTYRLARRWSGAAAALASAWMLAVSPFAVRDAHYVKHDVPVTLAIVAALLAMSRLWPTIAQSPVGRVFRPGGTAPEPEARGPKPPEGSGLKAQGSGKILLLASALTGVAFATHYYAVFLALPLALTIVFASRAAGVGVVAARLAWCGLTTAGVFFALSPFLLAEPATAWRDIVANRQIVVDRSGAASGALFASVPVYARMLWNEALGGPLAIVLAVAGFVTLAWRSWRLALLVGVFPISFLAFISNTVAASRYLNPVLPVLGVCVAVALGPHGVAARMAGWWRAVVAVALVLAATWPALSLSLRTGDFFRQDDTRTLAQRYIEANVPPGATVLVQPYSAPITQSRESLVEALTFHLGDPASASTKFALRLRLDPWPSPAYRTLFLGDGGLDVDKIYVSYREVSGPEAVARLRERGVQYVVLKRDNTPEAAAAPLLAALGRNGRRMASFSPYRPDTPPPVLEAVAPFLHNTDTPIHRALERPGPIVDVWELR